MNSNNKENKTEFLALKLIPENMQVMEQLRNGPAMLKTDGLKHSIKTFEYIFGDWNSVKDSAEYKAAADALAKKGITRSEDTIDINIPFADIGDSWMVIPSGI